MKACATALFLSIALAASVAPADPSASETARELQRAGVTAAEQNRWNDALDAFTRSYTLDPSPKTLMNLASAELKTGHVVAGVDHYRKLLHAPGDLDGDQKDAAKAALGAGEARVCHVRVVLAKPDAVDRVTIDGNAVPPAAFGVDLAVDPGAHALVGWRGSDAGPKVDVVLSDGESRSVRIEGPAAKPLPPLPPTQPAERSTKLYASPWFWLVVGVVVAGGAATVCAIECRGRAQHTGNLPTITLP